MSISSTFFARVFRTKRRFGSFFLDTTSTNVAAEMTFVRKIRTFNVDEIDGRSNEMNEIKAEYFILQKSLSQFTFPFTS